MKKSFYDFEAIDLKGNKVGMDAFKGKTVVVVNTASKCGLTPQYEGLEQLYKTHQDKGLVILGFPCNQFAKQEPGNAADIQQFCQLNYGVSFPMFDKVDVNGANAHPIFAYLTNALRGFPGKKVKWNFTKFVIDANGKPVKRFGPQVKPKNMEAFLLKLMQ